jgi:hypothetical protein
MPPKTIAKSKAAKSKAAKSKAAKGSPATGKAANGKAANGKEKATPSTAAAAKAAKEGKEATEALKWLVQMGADAEAVAHRVAAIMTDKKSRGAAIDLRGMVMAARRFVRAMPDDASRIEAQAKAHANEEVEQQLALVANVARSVSAAAFIKFIPTFHDLHRHVAVLLPTYDSRYKYEQGNSSSTLKGPGGLKWKTRRTPDEDNDPRFPDFW